uniref:Uncharacterized protein n=1 Tax=Oryza rufipogon TaxID=4529 RepID=A0A0E0MW21_ORYRU
MGPPELLSKEEGNYSSKINVVIAEEEEKRRSRRRGTRLGYRRQVEVVVPRLGWGRGHREVFPVGLKVVASYVIRTILN